LLHSLQFYKKLSTCLEDVVWKTEDDMTKQEAKWYFYNKILISLWKCNILMSEFLLFQFLYSLFPLLVGLFGHLYISNIYILHCMLLFFWKAWSLCKNFRTKSFYNLHEMIYIRLFVYCIYLFIFYLKIVSFPLLPLSIWVSLWISPQKEC
jgi:hypothetical protein